MCIRDSSSSYFSDTSDFSSLVNSKNSWPWEVNWNERAEFSSTPYFRPCQFDVLFHEYSNSLKVCTIIYAALCETSVYAYYSNTRKSFIELQAEGNVYSYLVQIIFCHHFESLATVSYNRYVKSLNFALFGSKYMIYWLFSFSLCTLSRIRVRYRIGF